MHVCSARDSGVQVPRHRKSPNAMSGLYGAPSASRARPPALHAAAGGPTGGRKHGYRAIVGLRDKLRFVASELALQLALNSRSLPRLGWATLDAKPHPGPPERKLDLATWAVHYPHPELLQPKIHTLWDTTARRVRDKAASDATEWQGGCDHGWGKRNWPRNRPLHGSGRGGDRDS